MTAPPPSGIAKIESNEGGGEYKITELVWNPATEQYDAVAEGCGIRQAVARDWLRRPYGIPAYDMWWPAGYRAIRFWHGEAKGEKAELLIDIGPMPTVPFLVRVTKDGGYAGAPAGAPGGPANCSFTYTVKGWDAETTLHKDIYGNLATGMEPYFERMDHVEYCYGMIGLAAWWPEDIGGAELKLLLVLDETPQTTDYSIGYKDWYGDNKSLQFTAF